MPKKSGKLYSGGTECGSTKLISLKGCKSTTYKAGGSYDNNGIYHAPKHDTFLLPSFTPASNRLAEIERVKRGGK